MPRCCSGTLGFAWRGRAACAASSLLSLTVGCQMIRETDSAASFACLETLTVTFLCSRLRASGVGLASSVMEIRAVCWRSWARYRASCLFAVVLSCQVSAASCLSPTAQECALACPNSFQTTHRLHPICPFFPYFPEQLLLLLSGRRF